MSERHVHPCAALLATQTYTVLILDDVLPYRRQGRPLAVVGGSDGAALVRFEFTHWKTNNAQSRYRRLELLQLQRSTGATANDSGKWNTTVT